MKPPRDYEYKKQFILEVEHLSKNKKKRLVEGKIQVNCYVEDLPIEYHDHLEFWAYLRPPPSSNNPGNFNYRNYLARKGITATASISSPKQIVEHKKVQGNWFFHKLYQFKATYIQQRSATQAEATSSGVL